MVGCFAARPTRLPPIDKRTDTCEDGLSLGSQRTGGHRRVGGPAGEKAHGSRLKNSQKVYLRRIFGGVARATRTAAVLSNVLLSGVRSGGNLFPTWTGPDFADKLRSSERNFWRGTADRLGTHSVRRGAASTVLAAGGSFAQLLDAGRWRSPAYRLFIDMGAGETKAIASVLMEASDGEGAGRTEAQGGGNPTPEAFGIRKTSPCVKNDFESPYSLSLVRVMTRVDRCSMKYRTAV